MNLLVKVVAVVAVVLILAVAALRVRKLRRDEMRDLSKPVERRLRTPPLHKVVNVRFWRGG